MTANKSENVQLRGHCQQCGRQQAVVSGSMSKHGYTVKQGWFSGVCQGERYQPVERSREHADDLVLKIRAECDDLVDLAAKLKNGTAFPRFAKSGEKVPQEGKARWQLDDEMNPFAQAEAHYQREAVSTAAYHAENRARMGFSFSGQLEVVANTYHGQPLAEVKVDAGPVPIQSGERRVSAGGRVLTVSYCDRGRVNWKDEKGYKGWTGSQSFRRFPLAADGATA